MMQSLSTIFPAGWRRRQQARVRLVAAYRNLFAGAGSREDADLVLSDLAAKSGFYTVTGPKDSADAVRFAEGQRAVFKRIAGMLAMPETGLRELQEAAYQEAITTTKEGDI